MADLSNDAIRARVNELELRGGDDYVIGHEAGDRDRFMRCKEDLARALGMPVDTEWGDQVAAVWRLRGAVSTSRAVIAP